MAAWPATLPQSPLVEGYSEETPDLVVRTSMDEGPAKIRRRFTANVRNITHNYLLTQAQVATLDTFFVTTLAGGALTFTFINPRTAATDTYRFRSQPTYVPVSGSLWRTRLDLEITV